MLNTVEIVSSAGASFRPFFPSNPSISFPFNNKKAIITTIAKAKIDKAKTRKLNSVVVAADTTSFSGSFNQTLGGQLLPESHEKTSSKKRVFFLDVNPLCYAGNTPSLHSFGQWVSLLFSQVSRSDPVIAVIDGEKGSEIRRQLLPSYKAHRWKILNQSSHTQRFSRGHVGRSQQAITHILSKCNVPVIKVDGLEADDVIATLAGQVLQRGIRVVIASPDKDFKQLISEDVQIVMPLPELGRWSFYTLKHYKAQYDCNPQSDLSLRCIIGDEVDGVPGIQHVAPEFGRKTALKLIKKHGSLENLLNAAAVRTVGRPYAQDALTKHADYLRRNYKVLALKSDVSIQLQDEWLVERDTCNDTTALSNFFKLLEEGKELSHRRSNLSSC
ncbi:5'-3' exonuclease [Quillaja saponaria]|uniref:5'-3' exonuclease n=1 Tax=Quillaja saponaria TaxID=32244 RepID=A0AAD7Q349_QUISA|nr:5'-3' exonuclease [Quillaja saponaria]